MRPPFLFDLDGTLADTLADIAASTNHVRARHGLPALPDATVRTFVGDGARTLLARALHDVLPAEAAARERALDAAFDVYGEHHQHQCTVHARLYPGAHDHLQALHAAGHRLAVVTNKPERFAVPLVAHLGLAPLFRCVLGGDSLPVKKPDPAPLRHALQQLGWPKDAASLRLATMVGDGVQDLRAGRAAGVRTIGCLFGFGEPAKLRAERADGYWRAFGVVA